MWQKETSLLSAVNAGFAAISGKVIYLTAYSEKKQSLNGFSATVHIPAVYWASKMSKKHFNIAILYEVFKFHLSVPPNLDKNMKIEAVFQKFLRISEAKSAFLGQETTESIVIVKKNSNKNISNLFKANIMKNNV